MKPYERNNTGNIWAMYKDNNKTEHKKKIPLHYVKLTPHFHLET